MSCTIIIIYINSVWPYIICVWDSILQKETPEMNVPGSWVFKKSKIIEIDQKLLKWEQIEKNNKALIVVFFAVENDLAL